MSTIMRAKFSLYLLLSFFLVVFSNCESPYGKKMTKGIPVTGKVGEILVVCDDAVWESDLKSVLDSNLTQFILPYFPDVATFELIHRPLRGFTKGMKKYRNVLMLTLDENFSEEKGKITKEVDTWATGQVLIEITAKDYNQLTETCEKGLQQVHKEFDEASWKRIMERYKKQTNHVLETDIEKTFGISLALPDASKIVWRKSNFYRIELPTASKPIEFVGTGGQDAGLIFTGVMIYQYNYSDSSQLTLEALAQARDTMLKYNVPSEVEGMYMGTQYGRLTYPVMEGFTSVGGVEGVQMRGMFKFVGLGKFGTGGAFWACHFVNEKTKKIVCVSGYVDASPMSSWTQPLREVEAILKSVEIAK